MPHIMSNCAMLTKLYYFFIIIVMNDFLLKMESVSKRFLKTCALKNVNLNVKSGTVHAIMGANGAGKSTLMKCLFGIEKMDKGEIYFNGAKVKINNPREALKYGIVMVGQELETMDDKSIAENIFCNRHLSKKFGPFTIIDYKNMYKAADKLLKDIGLLVNSRRMLNELTVSQKQLVEIAKALSYNAKLIIFDEPTSSLTDHETNILFDIINKLKNKGVSFIYISHKMDEILKISDEVTILRDGEYIGTWDAKELDTTSIIKNMIGSELTNKFLEHGYTKDNVVLKVDNYSSIRNGISNISFELKEGEILGIAGLVGAKRTELMETIFGIKTKDNGKIKYNNTEININTPKDAIKNGIALLTEDRHATGIFPSLSVADNMSIVSIDKYTKNNVVIDKTELDKSIDEKIDKLNIKLSGKNEPIEFLSGGNQQKIIIARWLINNPNVLILDEPTRGIDIASKYEIYSIISDLAKNGKSIIFISSEIPELIGIADRIIVMSDGKIAGTLSGSNITKEEILNLSYKYLS